MFTACLFGVSGAQPRCGALGSPANRDPLPGSPSPSLVNLATLASLALPLSYTVRNGSCRWSHGFNNTALPTAEAPSANSPTQSRGSGTTTSRETADKSFILAVSLPPFSSGCTKSRRIPDAACRAASATADRRTLDLVPLSIASMTICVRCVSQRRGHEHRLVILREPLTTDCATSKRKSSRSSVDMVGLSCGIRLHLFVVQPRFA